MRATGIYADVPMDEYHAEEGISSTGVSLILDCPKRYYHKYYTEQSDDESKAESEKFLIGKAFHMLLLEPEKFDSLFYWMTCEVDLRTKVGKEEYAMAIEKASGRQIIRLKDYELLMAMRMAALENKIWESIHNQKVEHSVYWNSGLYNTRMRARPDLFTNNLIIDVKTTSSIAGFQRSIKNFGYHRQAAMQIDGLKAIDGMERLFGFFVIEDKAPYMTALFTLDEAALNQGRREYMDAAIIYSECFQTGIWPGYSESTDSNGELIAKFTTISLPKWAMEDL